MASCSQWSISRPRIFDILAPVQNILIAGCGGGYDILSGLPLYFNLTAQGKNVTLANFSFTSLSSMGLDKLCDGCYIVKNSTKLPERYKDSGVYFPEYYLACWLAETTKKEEIKIYAFSRENGGKRQSIVYKTLAKTLNIEAIVLVDGGTDSLTFGSEQNMGTPTEDHTSMISAWDCSEAKIKLLVCLGFGVDTYHGISHALFLENVATMEKAGGFYGCFSVPRNSVEGEMLINGYDSVSSKMQSSIVCASVTDAMKGEFGNHHSTPRTGNSTLFINALMAIYWVFDLHTAVSQIPYRLELLATSSVIDVIKLISKHQDEVEKSGNTRKSLPLPM